jgi:hypothetical protein
MVPEPKRRRLPLTGRAAKEPWTSAEGRFFIQEEEGWGSILDSQGWFIAKLEDTLDPAANAARIVDCVNVLQGLDPAGLPGLLSAAESAIAALADPSGSGSKAARERLVSALERLKSAPADEAIP